MTVAALRSRQDADRPKSVVAVLEKYQELLALLRRSKERAGDEFSPFAEVQLALVDEVVTDCRVACFGTDGHGRPLTPPLTLIIRRRKPQVVGQQQFEWKEAA